MWETSGEIGLIIVMCSTDMASQFEGGYNDFNHFDFHFYLCSVEYELVS